MPHTYFRDTFSYLPEISPNWTIVQEKLLNPWYFEHIQMSRSYLFGENPVLTEQQGQRDFMSPGMGSVEINLDDHTDR